MVQIHWRNGKAFQHNGIMARGQIFSSYNANNSLKDAASTRSPSTRSNICYCVSAKCQDSCFFRRHRTSACNSLCVRMMKALNTTQPNAQQLQLASECKECLLRDQQPSNIGDLMYGQISSDVVVNTEEEIASLPQPQVPQIVFDIGDAAEVDDTTMQNLNKMLVPGTEVTVYDKPKEKNKMDTEPMVMAKGLLTSRAQDKKIFIKVQGGGDDFNFNYTTSTRREVMVSYCLPYSLF